MNKAILLFVIFLHLSVKAQSQDTTIYQSCRKASDPITVNGEGIIFDSCPTFKKGIHDLLKYISTHIRYPASARKNHVEGRVITSVIIEQDGSVSHGKIQSGISEDLNQEALRVIDSLPRWKPGILHGKPVRVIYYIPILFKLPDSKS